ncbi:SDR family oxidoreductase [Paenibacillus sp. MSJ-34]|uniref:SDR family oxidoreductase n=1 Tax=Paenibacillus sp. MSJ-34 TaxID=2841529 RepID=UPI001C1250C0|nr:SDR family NAD(P)-dependent oxidoreductase [Paenibacillus sp. MSJ-34]MBU5442341.1 SDR family oxidoreductase [Paenibacillus sp. MSJ-34]
MNLAVVTGASSGIGLAIARMLIDMDYFVYGLSRNPDKAGLPHERYIPYRCDLRDIDEIMRAAEHIQAFAREGGHRLGVLVNNAGLAYFAPHEQIGPRQIAEMIAVNLQAPLILTQQLLRRIKQDKGTIIQISSVTAKKSSTHGCAYAATKAGLSHFSLSLFDEIRKTGARVVSLHPDMTQTPFYDRLDFREGEEPDSYITPECVADAVRTVLTLREGSVITDLTIRPQRHQIRRKPR